MFFKKRISKIIPSFFTIKEGSTFLTKPLFPQGREDVTALLGARDRYALRLADHQRSTPDCAGWDRMGLGYMECERTTVNRKFKSSKFARTSHSVL